MGMNTKKRETREGEKGRCIGGKGKHEKQILNTVSSKNNDKD